MLTPEPRREPSSYAGRAAPESFTHAAIDGWRSSNDSALLESTSGIPVPGSGPPRASPSQAHGTTPMQSEKHILWNLGHIYYS